LVFPEEQDIHIPSPYAETNEESNKKLKPENAYSFKLSFTSCIIYIFRLQMDRSLKKLAHTNKFTSHTYSRFMSLQHICDHSG
jgi:hypothetical protein